MHPFSFVCEIYWKSIMASQKENLPNNPSSSSIHTDNSVTPTQLLSVAIKKRKSLMGTKDRDLRQELLISGMIQNLCKHIGEERAARKRRRCTDFCSSYSSKIPDIPVSQIPLPPSEEPQPKKERLASIPQDQERFTVLSVRSGHSLSQTSPQESSKVLTPDPDQPSQAKRQVKKRPGRKATNFDEKDPFGLDEFFRSISSISVR